jgi:hypothetical protein
MYHESFQGSEPFYKRISIGDMILSPDRIGPQEVRNVQIFPMMDPVNNIVFTSDLRTAVIIAIVITTPKIIRYSVAVCDLTDCKSKPLNI